MNISLIVIFIILITHYIADFICQTDWEAQNKSVNNMALGSHVFTYIIVWILPSAFLDNSNNGYNLISWWAINYVAHFGTDYVTSRISKYYFNKQDYHNGFIVIGFDQIIHYATLILTYCWLLQ